MEVLGKFDQFFQVRKNVIIERARFNTRCQQECETSEQYITALYNLVETCDYADLKEEMIRDRLVVGIRDKFLSERLQMNAALTLEKAKTAVRQREAIQDSKPFWKGENSSDPIPVDALKGKIHGKQTRKTTMNPSNTNASAKSCTQCGRGSHKQEKFPARDAECHTCHKKRHYIVSHC